MINSVWQIFLSGGIPISVAFAIVFALWQIFKSKAQPELRFDETTHAKGSLACMLLFMCKYSNRRDCSDK